MQTSQTFQAAFVIYIQGNVITAHIWSHYVCKTNPSVDQCVWGRRAGEGGDDMKCYVLIGEDECHRLVCLTQLSKWLVNVVSFHGKLEHGKEPFIIFISKTLCLSVCMQAMQKTYWPTVSIIQPVIDNINSKLNSVH